ncbi:hypothetical protein Q4610_02730 [Sphingobium sp. HBC34]|uniref:Uncharacterized protein n=1 Tax=Sphingobium cyanobacteriorum TaxID=3063954 RepID=A0ABT8ZK77_9SPHN|nr:hypothetical protein [Sphingobium sp. HBC34]MDO7833951.1 hypothetical protein [Sphingobium sp. HBC34]
MTATVAAPSLLDRPVAGGPLLTLLAGWLGLDQLLLWRFLGLPFWACGLGAIIILGLCVWLLRATRSLRGPTIGALLLCLVVAILLMLLGGEGRFFYANIDWQVRLAVLRDMSVNPWPFVYSARGAPDMLRAPIGMFLAPAIAAKTLGLRAADILLWLQNSLLIATLLALGAALFNTRRAKLIALAVIIGFSGLDALGRLLFRGGLSDHLENWAYLQYSSTITLAFWVPQHALAGWVGALGFLLWRGGRLSLGPYLALLPLTALWSPLGLIGAMPFAALAGGRALIAGTLRLSDIGLPALATLLCLPGLLYLGAAGEGVGARLMAVAPLQWGLFELLEVLVYVAPLALLLRPRFGRDTLALLTLWLLVIPFIQIGASIDFMMRGSVSALTILAVMAADALIVDRRARLWLVPPLLIGSITGLYEIRRALAHPPAPQVRCSFFKAWDQSFGFQPKDSYLAPLSEMPAPIRPQHPVRVSPAEPATCWDGHWYHPNEKYI